MKKSNPILLTALLVACGISQVATAADTSIITITANVTASPCTVNTTNLALEIGPVQASTLATAGATSGWSPTKTISLTNCPAGTSSVQATFSGTPASNGDTNGYANTGVDKSISVQLADDAGTINYLSNGKSTADTPVVNNAVDFKVRARLYTSGAAQPSDVSSTVNVSFTYK